MLHPAPRHRIHIDGVVRALSQERAPVIDRVSYEVAPLHTGRRRGRMGLLGMGRAWPAGDPRGDSMRAGDRSLRHGPRKHPLRAEKLDVSGDDAVLELRGLHILGSERHESRRIDRQLRGRSGRQGDPGASEFFLSLARDQRPRPRVRPPRDRVEHIMAVGTQGIDNGPVYSFIAQESQAASWGAGSITSALSTSAANASAALTVASGRQRYRWSSTSDANPYFR